MDIGSSVIVRANLAGIVYGKLTIIDNFRVVLANARQIWAWSSGALCVLDIAAHGITTTTNDDHRLSAPAPLVELRRDDCDQIALMTDDAVTSLDAIASWTS